MLNCHIFISILVTFLFSTVYGRKKDILKKRCVCITMNVTAKTVPHGEEKEEAENEIF